MNKVSLVGNVVNDLELKEYKNDEGEGKYVRFTLAINEYSVRKNERIATFVEVVAFGKKAVILAHNVGKGSKLAVEGKLRTSSYLNSEGEKSRKLTEYIKEHYSYEYYFYIDLNIKREAEEYARSYQAVYENQKEYWRVVKKRNREYKKKRIKELYGLKK